MSARVPTHQPQHETEGFRAPDLGYEPRAGTGLVRYLEHGFPHPLVRWHVHGNELPSEKALAHFGSLVKKAISH